MPIIQFPPIVNIFITSRCNNNCKHCFGPKNVIEMDFLKLKELFLLLHTKGAKAVLLGGGEPLLRDDFSEILKELKRYNFKIFLDTNGDLFFRYRDLITEHVSVIGLPVDFPDSSYRNEDNLKTVFKILGYYKGLKKRLIIRVGTVVTKDNSKRLNEIGKLLKNYPVDIWKIYQFVPQNYNAIKNRSSLEISQREFDEATQGIKDIFSGNFKVVISRREDRNRAYFFIASDGTVFIPVDDLNICRQAEMGNIFDGDISDKWKKVVSEKNYINNAEATFDYRFDVLS